MVVWSSSHEYSDTKTRRLSRMFCLCIDISAFGLCACFDWVLRAFVAFEDSYERPCTGEAAFLALSTAAEWLHDIAGTLFPAYSNA